MNLLCPILILMALIQLPANAQVSEPSVMSEKLSESDLKIVGRGLESKDTHEILALACYVPDCSELRFAQINAAQNEVTYIGESILAPITQDSKLREKAVQLLINDFFFFNHTLASAKRLDHQVLKNAAIYGVEVAAIITTAATFGASAALLVGAGAYASGSILNNYSSIDRLANGPANGTWNSKEGWNWSQAPQKISGKLFSELAARIDHGRWLWTYALYLPAGADEYGSTYKKKSLRIRRDLVKKGVLFHAQTWSTSDWFKRSY